VKKYVPAFALLLVFLVSTLSLTAIAQSSQTTSDSATVPAAGPSQDSVRPATSSNVTTSGGTAGTIPVFQTATAIENSPIFDSGGNIGIGTITPTSLLNVISNPGTFANVEHDFISSYVNGFTPQGSPDPPQLAAEAISGGITVDAGSTVVNALGVAGYALNYAFGTNPSSGKPETNAAGGYFWATAAGWNDDVSSPIGSKVWGANMLVNDVKGVEGTTLIGEEIDIDTISSPNYVYGLQITGGWEGTMPPWNSYGINIEAGTGSTQQLAYGLVSSNGSVSKASLFSGALCASATCDSQPINFASMNSGTQITTGIQADTVGSIWLNPAPSQYVVANGSLQVNGSFSATGSKSFKIDHPLDPANKYLYHTSVESPDMMNIYNGNAVLDAKGEAEIQLPDYFEALNQDFRYQLTCIGGFAPVYVSREIENNRFRIAGGISGLKVSWQVTGIRHDAYAEAHRSPVEVEKPTEDRGHYLHPELFGAAQDKAIGAH
jgi:hypothetical protein